MKPALFGLENSNRDFTLKETWGKNQFNSSFPASLACYMGSKGIKLKYLIIVLQNYLIKIMKIKVVDLFAGCGGLSLGFMQAGFDIVAAFDNWKPTLEVYRKNFDHDSIDIDLSENAACEKIYSYKPDMIIGGPPCQDFSSAGKRDEGLGRANLTISFANIIEKIKPKYFLMENVDRITKSKKLLEAKKIFKSAGYGLSYGVLDASFCGVPQSRKRFILFGELNGNDHTLENYFNKNKSKKQMTIRDYLGSSLGIEHYYRHPRNYSRRGVYSIDEPSPTIRGVNRPVPKGYKGNKNDTSVLSEKIRPLATEERALIQTFPETFQWLGKKTNLEQMIGNAVPVNLAKFVASCITEYIEDKNDGKFIFDEGECQLSLEF